MRLPPLDRLTQTLFEVDLGPPAEVLPCSGDVESPSGLAVGTGCVPDDGPFEADQTRDRLGQLTNGDLLAVAEVSSG